MYVYFTLCPSQPVKDMEQILFTRISQVPTLMEADYINPFILLFFYFILFIYLFIYFETGSHVSQAGLEL